MRPTRRGLLTLAVLAPVALGTAACGFQPLYGGRGAANVSAKLQEVDIGIIPDQYGQQLRNLLIDRFYKDGRPAHSQYRLLTTLTAAEQKLALQKDATAVRAQLVVYAPYQLVDIATGKVVLSALSRSFISYNVLEQQYAGLVTVENAYDRALLEVSNDITARVAMYLNRPPEIKVDDGTGAGTGSATP
ncbi:LPS assembly lipoprotein LptE [Azospirillum rugosum]|uniref:LPS-assembly lipoprotein n=1 Tax=Azospirillum rugosum TaxID=416170 RepID=A0ABS4SR71_9PROT|nr:LPS assembly lipoprotein LptE [Azospirillum rugosum]MBP2293890.1 LPS-assembly lipoprotein [Azospirillum rugosum]MDQ0526923.1 LPS-assembly lipoprotein [Azospirillum rugosum]